MVSCEACSLRTDNPCNRATGKIHWDGVVVKECAEEISPASIVLENTPPFLHLIERVVLFGYCWLCKVHLNFTCHHRLDLLVCLGFL